MGQAQILLRFYGGRGIRWFRLKETRRMILDFTFDFTGKLHGLMQIFENMRMQFDANIKV